MKELYKGHYQNALRGQKLATEAAKLKSDKVKEEYNKTPNKCTNCGNDLTYPQRHNKFCCSSCAASFNNKNRGGHKEETKIKISKKLEGRTLSPEHKEKSIKSLQRVVKQRHDEGYERFLNKKTGKNCVICNTEITYENRFRKTCSDECQIKSKTNRKYLNGSRKTINYNGIILESSWELKLAEWLDEYKIKWIRPEPIKWVLDGKNKLYYPDFYLPDFNLYLDPKNPYCMDKDRVKMEIVSKEINIIFGDIDYVITKLGDVV